MSPVTRLGTRRLRRVQWLLLAVAAILIAAGTLKQLSTIAPRQTGTNQRAPAGFFVKAPARTGICQSAETLFAGTRSLRMTVARVRGAAGSLEVRVRSGRRTLASGRLDPGWRQGVVDVPITPVPRRTNSGVDVCVRSTRGRLAFGSEPVDRSTGATSGRRRLQGRISLISYGRPQSLLEAMGQVAAHYGYGAASWSGGWMLVVVFALVMLALGLAGAALLQPRARLVVGAVLAGTVAWALLTPPFHVPDETAHFAYVSSIVEKRTLPHAVPGKGEGSPKLRAVLGEGLRFYDVIGAATSKPPFTAGEERALRTAEARPLSRATSNAATASANPPLYYLLQAPAYAVTRGGSPLTQLLVMRMVSAALSALTALFILLFLRELMPRNPVAAAAGALVCGFQPVFGFIGSGVNADAGLFTASAALLFACAVILRRGLTVGRAVILGAAIAAGLLIKPLFVGMVPAGLAALALATLRRRASWWERLRSLAAGLAVAAVPVLLYHLVGTAAFDHGFLPNAGTGIAAAAVTAPSSFPVGFRGEVSYIWQLFLPRLWFMHHLFNFSPVRDTWFDGLVGRFGWLDYAFPGRVTDEALTVVWFVLGFAAAGLVRCWRAVRAQWRLMLCLALALLGILAAIGTQQYRAAATGGDQFIQPRYLLPLLSLYGAISATATLALGRRAVPLLAVPLVGIAFYHDVASMILTLSRYYA